MKGHAKLVGCPVSSAEKRFCDIDLLTIQQSATRRRALVEGSGGYNHEHTTVTATSVYYNAQLNHRFHRQSHRGARCRVGIMRLGHHWTSEHRMPVSRKTWHRPSEVRLKISR